MIVNHQFSNSPIYFPTWDIDKLFLGTFNPSCGQQLDYYYRRKVNGFWKILKHYDYNNKYNFNDFNQLKGFMTDKCFGCIDVIRSVDFPDIKEKKICGTGYTDNNLFTVKGFTREYIFEDIKNYIIRNNITNVFSTWGVRNNPKEFNILLTDFKVFCTQNEINYTPLDSPSGRLYKGPNIDRININWWNSLDQYFQ